MKKLFTLLSFLITCVAGAGAQTSVLCENWTTYDSTTANANYNGFTLTYFSRYSYYTSMASSGPSGPNSYKFGVDSATMITPNIATADHFHFWMKGNAASGGSLANGAFYIYETADGINYTLIDMINPIPTTSGIREYALSPGSTNVKFFYDKDSGNVAFDDFCATIGSVGFSDPTKSTAFSAFPNPSRGVVNVNLNNPRNGQLIITNLLGSEMKRFATKSNETYSVLDLTDLQDGVYFIKVKTDLGESTQRVVIRK